MFIGRNVFQAPDPARMMRVLRQIIHDDLSVEAALAELE
jgi:DhnA family fructose-bisphosphate aldolase class Ia